MINDETESSDDNYGETLVKSKFELNGTQRPQDPVVPPTESRIEFIKSIMQNSTTLEPMVDFDMCDTESYSALIHKKKILDISKFFNSLSMKLYYLKSGTTGHTFKAIHRDNPTIMFAVKVCAYPKDDYGGIDNWGRPENAELKMVKLTSQFVINGKTPHFVLPFGTFNTSIKKFVHMPQSMLDTNNKNDKRLDTYRKFINRYRNGELEDFVSILISEWCDRGDLLDYIRSSYKSMTVRDWRVILFQIIYTLAKVQYIYPNFKHNDLKANNILVKNTEQQPDRTLYYKYGIGNKRFIIPDIGMQVKIWDFDFSTIEGIVENNKVNSKWTAKHNITKKENKYYDMHYFFNTLISERFFPQFYTGGAPDEIVEFVHRVIPREFRFGSEYTNKNGTEYINKKGRIQVDTEYTTPYKVIMTDPLFGKYRHTE
jgi:serine/threonine protein kinase